jgi:O-antigen/teichoic acid export membrane protein
MAIPSKLRNLAGQTAIYGLSSILGRFLNYLLVPLHTLQYTTDQYGVITEMYAYVAFLVVLLTYGMETTFFRFLNRKGYDGLQVYSTVLFSVLSTSIIFIAVALMFNQPIANWLRYPDENEYVIWFAIIVGLDAISSIPLAKLRSENKAIRFASVNLISIVVNIGLNVFFVYYCIEAYKAGVHNWFVDTFYNPQIGVGYVFIANLISGIVKFLLVTPGILGIRVKPSYSLWKELIVYTSPLLFAGLAGIINETLDRVILKRMLIEDLGNTVALSELGIYGACYKISIIISLFIQAFRYAAEPFFFSQAEEKDSGATYTKVMNIFVAVCGLIFLGVMFYLDVLKYFIPNQDYWVGLKVVPILLMANICLGIYYNQSIWYKLSDKTIMGAYISVVGALITIGFNLLLIPHLGYMGSAWATLICYASMVVLSFYLGRKYYPIPYEMKSIFLTLGAFLILWIFAEFIESGNKVLDYSIRSLLILVFVLWNVRREGLLKRLKIGS